MLIRFKIQPFREFHCGRDYTRSLTIMKIKIITTFLFFLCLSCGKQKGESKPDESGKRASFGKGWSISSTNDWVKNEGLLNVESIIYDEVNQVFYATNGIDYEPGTNGFISKISENGKLQELKWIEHLNRPTGMAIQDSLLYVADVNSLVVINTRNGKIVEKFLEPIANSGLNDVSISKKGKVYVSASFVHSIFRLNNGTLELWSKDEEKLKWANGLIANDKQIVVAGLNLSTINTDSKRITQIELNAPIKDFDGIVADGLGGYFLTTVENSGLFHVNAQKNITKLMEGDVYFGDLEFNPDRKEIYIPRGNKKTGEFFITVFTVEKNR